MAGNKRTYTLDETMTILNDWLDEEDNPPEDAVDDLRDLNGKDVPDDSNQSDSDEEASDDEEAENPTADVNVPPRFRKYLTRKRNVKSIDTALDMENYKEINYLNSNGQWESFTGYLGPKADKATKKIFWCSDEPSTIGRQRGCDVITGPVSCLKPNIVVNSELDAWDLFISDEMLTLVADKTNLRIDSTRAKLATSEKYTANPSKYTWYGETDPVELRAYFGLLYARGLLGQNLHKTNLLFTEHSHFIFGATMSKNRMQFLYAHISFDTLEERTAVWPTDRFAAYRPFWEMFNYNLSKPLFPSEYLSIDETLYPMRQQIAFRQYNPKKPHKYGLLLKSLNDARFPYTYKATPYAGKPSSGNGPYYLDKTLAYVKYLVSTTEMDTSLKGRCITTDRLYTSIEQANWLLARKITSLGTMEAKRIGIPAELKDTKNREVFSTTCHFEKKDKNLCFNTYTVKTKSTGLKNVFMLSTLRPLKGITKDDQKEKPALYKLYDFTKGGTDIVDQLNDFYSTRSKSLRWVCVAMFYTLDTSRVNAKTVFCMSRGIEPQKYSSYKFAWELALSLAKPYVQARNRNGLLRSIQLKMDIMLGNATHPVEEPVADNFQPPATKKRCYIHMEAATTKKDKDCAPKSKQMCHLCGKIACNEHLKRVCLKCLK